MTRDRSSDSEGRHGAGDELTTGGSPGRRSANAQELEAEIGRCRIRRPSRGRVRQRADGAARVACALHGDNPCDIRSPRSEAAPDTRRGQQQAGG